MMNKRIQTIITSALLGLSIFNTSVNVLATDKMFTNHTVKSGLSQGTVFAMFQDSNGYIWIGTADGLNRYNGYEYKKYYKNSDKENSIVSNEIRTITEDKNKNLWIGTSEGISKMNLDNYKIKNYTSNNSNICNSDIKEICVTKDGKVIISSGDGLSIYDEKEDDFKRIEYNQGGSFYSLESHEDNILYGVCDGVIFQLNTETLAVKEINTENLKRSLFYDMINDIIVEDNIIWIGTASKGLYKYDMNTDEILDNKIMIKEEQDNIAYAINHLYKDKMGNMFLATENGLVSYDVDGKENMYQYDLYDKYTIVNNNILSMMQDSSGLMWIGTYSGISTFRPDEGVTHYGNNPNSQGEGLLGNLIHGLYEDEEGKIWAGCNGYGITILDRKNNKYEYLTENSSNPISCNGVNDIKGNKDKVFIGSDYGVDILDKKTGTIKNISSELSGYSVFCLYLDGDFLWAGTVNGIDKININDYSVENYNYVYESTNIDDYITSAITKDSEGIMWFGLGINGGLVKFNPSNNEVKSYQSSEEKGSLSDNSILCINEDKYGKIWIGTTGGLNIYDKKEDSFKLISTEDGLSNNTIYSIIFDEIRNDVWVSTNLGVERIMIDNDSISVQEHIRNNEFNNNAYLITSTGEYVFGGIDGLYIFDPSKAVQNNYVPSLKFDTFKVNGIEVNKFDNISIEENNTSLSIKLFTTIYDNSKNTKFFYKIDKNSEKWIPIEGNEITLSNLSAGDYTIFFKALSTNGSYSISDEISFEVKPPFWKGKSAKFVYVSGLILIFMYGYKKIRKMDDTIAIKDNQLYKQIEEKNELLEKVLELERRKNNYLVNMSHELRTPLNVIYSIQQLLNDLNDKDKITKKELSRYIEMCCKNVHRLLKLINDLIDSSKIDAGSYKLFVEEKDLVYVVEEAALSLKSLVEQKGINLIFDTEIEECVMIFDENAIERCIINIVNNASKFTDADGEIFVYISDLDDKIKIDIRDTGSGIPEENLDTIFDRFSQVVNSKREASSGGSGLGLTITKRLVELHNGEISVTSKINEGSTFTIVLPKTVKEEKEEKGEE